MNTWIARKFKSLNAPRTVAAVTALAVILSVGSYVLLKPAAASASSVAPIAAAAPALDESSVSPLLSLDRAMETLAAHVTPAVVNVTVAAKGKHQETSEDDQNEFQKFFGQQFGPGMRPGPQIEHGLGSGIIISPDGYIVTNNHVIDGAVDIRVTMTDRRVLPAKLIGADPLTDLAVIKVNASNLPSLPWGDSTALMPGQTVLAFGNPYGFRFTVTRGIVSALNRPNPFAQDRRSPGEFIQTDAAINPGNSGGPLVSARGEVVGINTFLISPSGSFSGMGFAIPAQVAKPVVESLLKYGKVEHARVGIGITDVTPENVKFFHMDKAIGALVSQVEPDSPGAKAGLKVGDVITQVNGKKVDDAGQLQVLISQQRPGTKVELGIIRDGKSETVPVTLEALDARHGEAKAGQEHGKARWGLGLMEIDPDAREQLQLPANVRGVVVTNVQPGSPADNAGISRGDVITEVNRKDVQSVSDVQRELGGVADGQDALVLVWSRGGSSFVVMHSAEGQPAEQGE
ncbi:MAG TPA: DegQ family serine endoprotease [Candidatus Angelobacter sp.]|nr:DegQ family serine endoprotease [Candidatus Angelobacter sp.]